MPTPNPKPKRKPSRRGKVKRLDNAFSIYIRNRDNWTCQTCGSREKAKLQCGHLFSRVAYSTRWDERNAYCQCSGCNMRHEYDPGPLTIRFLRDYTEEGYDALHRKFRETAKYKDSDLDAMIRSYEAANKENEK